jgi:hypothetical protein
MKKLIFLLILLFHISNFGQEKSYFKIVPEINKDTLEILNIDSLKYDINLYINENKIYKISITGTLGFVNKFKITKVFGFSLYSTNGKNFDLKIPNIALEKVNDKPNILNYEVRDFIYDINEYKNKNFSIDSLKTIISNFNPRPLDFNIRNAQIMFWSDKNQNVMTFRKKQLYVYFSKNDIKYINVYKDGELILKIDYHLLVK